MGNRMNRPDIDTAKLLSVVVSKESAHEPEVIDKCDAALKEWGLTFEAALEELQTRGVFK